MTYKISDKRVEYRNGIKHSLQFEEAVFLWLPVSQSDFDLVSVGDTVTLTVDIVTP